MFERWETKPGINPIPILVSFLTSLGIGLTMCTLSNVPDLTLLDPQILEAPPHAAGLFSYDINFNSSLIYISLQ